MRKMILNVVAAFSLFSVPCLAEITVPFDGGNPKLSDIAASLPVLPKADSPAAAGDGAAPAQDNLPEWTIMVFVNAKNDLEEYGLADVNEMEAVGSTDKVKIAVEMGRIKGYTEADGDWTGSRRYIIRKDADSSVITSPVLQEISKVDMGSWKHLVEFVKWAKAAAPAKHYMLIMWDHGSGWIKNADSSRSISFDEETKNSITVPQIAWTLKETGRVDILAFDACLMQMAEVGYQAREYADYMVGSEETEPGEGQAYDLFLSKLAAADNLEPLTVAKLSADAYAEFYTAAKSPSTQSVLDLSRMDAFAKALDGWVSAAFSSREASSLKKSKGQTQYFYYGDNKDLLHFVKLARAATYNPDFAAECDKFSAFLSGSLIKHNRTNGDQYANASGLAVYLPTWQYNRAYSGLAMSQETRWPEFLRWVLSAQ